MSTNKHVDTTLIPAATSAAGSPPPQEGLEREGSTASDPSASSSPSARAIPPTKAYYYSPTQLAPSPVQPNEEVGNDTKEKPVDIAPKHFPYAIRVCCGNANPTLAKEVCALMGCELLDCNLSETASGAVHVKLKESVASHDVYVVQSACKGEGGTTDLNTSLMELLFLIRRLKLARAERVTAVIPYFAYSRQDRKTELRCPLSASAVAQMLIQMGVDRVVTLDLHSGQVQGAFHNLPFDNLWMYQEFAQCLREKLPLHDPDTKVAIVSPDAGGVVRARKLADILNISQVVTILKRRAVAGQVATMQTVGDVKGYICVIVDDIVDTGGTLAKACELLVELGAVNVYACCTHAIMSEPASTTMSNCKALKELIVSDSIPQKNNLVRCKKLHVLPIAPMLAQVILRHHTEQSVSTLFNAPTPKSLSISYTTPPPPGAAQGFPADPPAVPAAAATTVHPSPPVVE